MNLVCSSIRSVSSFFSVYDACFDPGGEHIIVAAGANVHVYNAKHGKLLHSLKGKLSIYFVCNSSETFCLLWESFFFFNVKVST